MSNTRVHCQCHAHTRHVLHTYSNTWSRSRQQEQYSSGKKESDKVECKTQTKTDEAKKSRRKMLRKGKLELQMQQLIGT